MQIRRKERTETAGRKICLQLGKRGNTDEDKKAENSSGKVRRNAGNSAA